MDRGDRPAKGRITDLRASLEEIEEAIKKLHAPLRAGSPRRHHYIPKFLLRQFSGRQKQLMRITLPFQENQSSRKATHINKLAVAKDFYTAETHQGPSEVNENFLAEWDNAAAELIRKLLNPEAWPIPEEEKLKLSIWFSLLLSRSPHFRRMTEALAEVVTQFASEAVDSAPLDDVLELHQNHHIKMMLNALEQLAEPIYHRHWMLVRLSADGLVLPDSVPIMLGGPPDPQLGVGLATATELIFPVDRRHLICMHTFGPPLPPVIEVPEAASSYMIQHYNNPLISGSWSELFCHPDDYAQVIHIAERHGGAPLFSSGGTMGTDQDIDGVNRLPHRAFPRRYRHQAS